MILRCLVVALVCALAWEVAYAETNAPVRVEFREPHARAYLVQPPVAGNLRATSAGVSSWVQASREGSGDIVQLGSRLVLQLEPGYLPEKMIAAHSVSVARIVKPNLFILQATNAEAAISAAADLAVQQGVIAAYPVMRRPFGFRDTYRRAPNDPLFARQWHLENRGTDFNLAGPDFNIRAAWPVTQGENVLVAVADDGLQLDHPELEHRAAGNPHFDFFNNANDGGPASSDANHATAVAGLIAAEMDNKTGVAGIAPKAGLASWVIFGESFFGMESFIDDEQLLNMFQYASNRVSVQNHSWGSVSTALSSFDTLSDEGIENAVTRGRDGKGIVLVRAAGNDRENLINANDDSFVSDPRAIAVAAVRKDGRATSYSAPGACLLVSAPSGDVLDMDDDGFADAADPDAPGVLTTDRTGGDGYNTSPGDDGNYTDFDGTSASAPQIAGVAALLLSVNPRLTYRDVQQILVLSGRHYDLNDPDLKLNGAGFRVSHNQGYGVPDAGFAVQIARLWTNRPALRRVSHTNNVQQSIPDDSLRVVCAGPDLPASLTSLRTLPSQGPHPDDPHELIPLVYVGQANEDLTEDLHGKGALIQRGESFFFEKIARAASAGASFAVIFNNVGTTEIQPMGGTGFVPIPAVSIGKSDGDALRDFLADHPATKARLSLSPAAVHFSVHDTLVCEQVGVRLKTTHLSRSDVRVTLISPMGTRSVLQAINLDNSRDPADWTYWSTQHFFESSSGEWRLEVSDERNSTVRISGAGRTAAIGDITYAELIINGVPIVDSDADGLDDSWELKNFGNLKSGPQEDPDHDGYNNAFEQLLATDPNHSGTTFMVDITELDGGYSRLSWPGHEGVTYTVQAADSLTSPFSNIASISGHFPVTEWIPPSTGPSERFYRVAE